MFVKFIEETGKVVGVGPRKDPNFNCLEVDLDQVKDIIEGRDSKKNYIIQYNAKSRDLELVNIHEQIFDGASVNDFIYEIPQINIIDPDILVIQNQKQNFWKIQTGKELQNKLKSKGIRLNTTLDFSVTAKHDPNVLYKTFSIDFSRILDENQAKIEFDMPFEYKKQDVSVFTARRFDSYQFLRIADE